MNVWLAVAAGGAAGAVLRFAAGRILQHPDAFPWATLLVNVSGSAIAGGLLWWLADRATDDPLRGFLLVGLLGALTTWSSFSLETVQLLQQGRVGEAAWNLGLTVSLCLGGCAAGAWLVRAWH